MSGRPSLSVRLWDPVDGDPSAPQHVFGVPVERTLSRRMDARGALVALQDHRVALTGPLVAIGRHRPLRLYVRSRMHTQRDALYRAWLTEVADVLEGMQPERATYSQHRPLTSSRSTE